MKQSILFDNVPAQDENTKSIGGQLVLKFSNDTSHKVTLYHSHVPIKTVDLSDRVAKRLFVVDVVELGATKSKLAAALQISRQTIHNYTETKKHFGQEGLLHNYSPTTSKSRRKQRENHVNRRGIGNKARQLEKIRKEQQAKLPRQVDLAFEANNAQIKADDQPFATQHDWKPTRYAGVFVYLITLIAQNQWLRLIMKYCGERYKLFMIFLLMVSQNIRSIEQLKNLRKREGGLILGLKGLPSRLNARKWLCDVSQKKIATQLLTDFFQSQLRTGVVGIGLWFIDGHHLPYTGKRRLHAGYNTQRRMPSAGQTNFVTCDKSGRIVDFEICEGKGDLRNHIVRLGLKWQQELPFTPIMVFDREGYGAAFFNTLKEKQIDFVTWEKHIDTQKLNALKADLFSDEFEFNGKKYRVFEGNKVFTHKPENEDNPPIKFALRRIFIWNVTSRRRTAVLTNTISMSTKDVARTILSRWGASENTFKHLAERHPLHYQPGFKFVKSEKQEIANPEYKEKKGLLNLAKRQLNRLYKKFSKTKEVFNKDGRQRENSQHMRLKKKIVQKEAQSDQLRQEMKQIPEKVDVSCLEDYRCFDRISNESKNLFDFVTSAVWNARKQMVEWIFPFYENKNEYIDLFYAITHCQGWIKSEKHKVTVRLEPLEQKSRRAVQEQFCRKLNSLNAIVPNGKFLNIEVGLSPLK